jgi:SNF2 family DNA or RNA helicase
LVSKFVLSLSGTPFPDPSVEKYLVFHLIHRFPTIQTYPKNIPTMKKIKSDKKFSGMKQYFIKGSINKIKNIKFNDIVVSHELYAEEAIIYNLMRDLYIIINQEITKREDQYDKQVFVAYRTSMHIKICQMLICPMLPCTQMWLTIADSTQRDTLVNIFARLIINDPRISSYFNTPSAVESSRFRVIMDLIKKHYDRDKIIIFSSSRKSLIIFQHLLKEILKINVFTLESSSNGDKRLAILNDFTKIPNGVLLLTYKIGAAGLNLQMANIVIKMDLYWDIETMKQATSRVFRNGQTKDVTSYTIIANTGIEDGILKKCITKYKAVKELETGNQKTMVHRISNEDITKIISSEANIIKQTELRSITQDDSSECKYTVVKLK